MAKNIWKRAPNFDHLPNSKFLAQIDRADKNKHFRKFCFPNYCSWLDLEAVESRKSRIFRALSFFYFMMHVHNILPSDKTLKNLQARYFFITLYQILQE